METGHHFLIWWMPFWHETASATYKNLNNIFFIKTYCILHICICISIFFYSSYLGNLVNNIFLSAIHCSYDFLIFIHKLLILILFLFCINLPVWNSFILYVYYNILFILLFLFKFNICLSKICQTAGLQQSGMFGYHIHGRI